MTKVSGQQVVTSAVASEMPLAAEIQEALGELVGAAREGLLALSVGLGLRVVHELMEAEVREVVGPKGKHDRDRKAKRHGHERGSVTLGGRRVEVSRPRMRTAEDERELPVQSYEYFADRDPLTRAVMDRVLVTTARTTSRKAHPPQHQCIAAAGYKGLYASVWASAPITTWHPRYRPTASPGTRSFRPNTAA
jgi:putative transposase